MKTAVLASVVFVFLGMGAPVASAQQPTNSFDALPQLLKIGQEVIVTDEAGKESQGKLVSVSDNEMVIAQKRLFPFHRAKRTFAKPLIARIDSVDTTWNGVLLGFAAGTVAGWALLQQAAENSAGDPWLWFYGALLGGIGGAGIGGVVDLANNETVYQRQLPPPRVALMPVVSRKTVGVMARGELSR